MLPAVCRNIFETNQVSNNILTNMLSSKIVTTDVNPPSISDSGNEITKQVFLQPGQYLFYALSVYFMFSFIFAPLKNNSKNSSVHLLIFVIYECCEPTFVIYFPLL